MATKGPRPGLGRIKWITILIPAVAVGLFEEVRHTLFAQQLHGPIGNLLTVGIAIVGIFIFSQAVFGILERMQASLMERNEELSTLNTLVATASQTLDLDEILAIALSGISRALGRQQVLAWLWEDKAGEMVLRAQRQVPPELAEKVATLRDGNVILEAIVKAGGPTSLDNSLDGASSGDPLRLQLLPLRAKGKLLGAIGVLDETPDPQDKQELLASIGSHLAMAIDNARLFQETLRRQQEAQALYKVGMEISTLLDIDKVLQSVLEKTQELLGADVVALALWDEQANEMVTKAARGFRTEPAKQTRQRVWRELNQRVLASGQAVVEDRQEDTEEMDSIARVEGTVSHVAVPLKVGKRVIGVLHGANRRPYAFSQEDLELFSSLANQAAIAVENARLYSQVQNLAVLEERDRLGREMHDSLAQVLGYISLKAASAQEQMAAKHSSQARTELRQIERAAQEAYVDVREAILGLRTSVVLGGGLLRALTEYLHKFSSQSGIKAELIPGQEANPLFPPAIEVQLIRIIQEALTNVRKHAQARRVWVRLETRGAQAEIQVEDDGQGFDLSQVLQREGRYGLHIMKERAESVGGRLAIETAPRQGTKVIISLPVRQAGLTPGKKDGRYESAADSLGGRPHPL